MPRWLTLTAPFTLAAFLFATLYAGHAFAQEPGGEPPPPPAAAPPPPSDENLEVAKQHFAAGRDAYSRQDFTTAVKEFKMAQAIKPSPVLDYNIGLAYEGLNRPKAATKYYQRYLAEKPDAQNRPEVEQKIAVLASQSAPPPPPNGDPNMPPQSNVVNDGDTGPAPPPVAAPSQYQYGQDPYGGAYQPPPPRKKSSKWWVVFPVLGGITLLLLIIWYAYEVNQATTQTFGALTSPSLGNNSRSNDTGVLFRF
jgi:hypothetical protein